MSDFTVYRGKCSPPQLRDILLMAMTIKNIKEIEAAMLRAGLKTPRFTDHIFLPANWCRGNNQVNRVEFCNYERLKAIRGSGATISPRMELFDVPNRTESVLGVSFWELIHIRKRSKSGNFFEAIQNFEILEESERVDKSYLRASFDVCVRRWNLNINTHWLKFLSNAGVVLERA